MRKILDKITGGFAAISALLIVVMMASIVYDVIMRNLFQPTVWAQPISEIILVYSTFFAVAWVLRRDGHVNFNLFSDRLKPYGRALLNTVAYVIGTLICLVLLWQSTYKLFNLIREGYTPITAFAVPEWTTYVAIPVGSLLLSIQFAVKLFDCIKILKKTGNFKTTQATNGEIE